MKFRAGLLTGTPGSLSGENVGFVGVSLALNHNVAELLVGAGIVLVNLTRVYP